MKLIVIVLFHYLHIKECYEDAKIFYISKYLLETYDIFIAIIALLSCLSWIAP